MNIAFIPVRGGSKSIPLKNIKPFCGKPLVYWSLKAIQESDAVDEVYVSTDHPEIKKTVEGFGFDKVKIYDRSAEHASDTASTEAAMLEFIHDHDFSDDDVFILVQATSPLIQSSDLDDALQSYHSSDMDSLLTCVRTKRFFWQEHGEPLNYDYNNRPRRQDFDGLLMENGCFYVSTIGKIKESKNRLSGKIGIHEMEEFTAIELDEEHDWVAAEELMKKYLLK